MKKFFFGKCLSFCKNRFNNSFDKIDVLTEKQMSNLVLYFNKSIMFLSGYKFEF